MADGLRERTAQRRQQVAGSGDPSKEVELRKQRMTSLSEQLNKQMRAYERALPSGFPVEQLIQDALQAVRATPDLVKCSELSVMGGLMTCAQLGLRPAVLGQAWLLPFWNKKTNTHEAAFIAGYKGFKELAFRSGTVSRLHGYPVYENDEFSVEYGSEPRMLHRPKMRDRGALLGTYCVVKYVNGEPDFEWMTEDELVEHRDKFAMAKRWNKETRKYEIFGPWIDHPLAMRIKTPCRLLLGRWVPLSPNRFEIPALQRAVEVDGTVRMNVDPDDDALAAAEHPRPDDVLPVGADDPDAPPPPDVIDGELVDDEPDAGGPS